MRVADSLYGILNPTGQAREIRFTINWWFLVTNLRDLLEAVPSDNQLETVEGRALE